jgi:protein-L-isoaspartate(D-aspartate) O-methyltransferase
MKFDRDKEVTYLIEKELRPDGITDERVIQALYRVRREKFIPESLLDRAYIVALMTQALDIQPEDRVLEIGTGSGYQTAILAELAQMVYSVERIESLAQKARTNLYSQGYSNVMLIVGDGSVGLPEYAPFHKIMVTAAAPHVPNSLREQLKEGGKMVIPVGGRSVQDLRLVEKALNGRIYTSTLCGCRFVPLIGEGSWND